MLALIAGYQTLDLKIKKAMSKGQDKYETELLVAINMRVTRIVKNDLIGHVAQFPLHDRFKVIGLSLPLPRSPV